MNAERARDLLRTLPHAVESLQWGNNLVYFVGDKTVGGKMFALLDLDGDLAHGVAMFAAGPERFHELLETSEDLFPARYLARAHWVAAKSWSALPDRQWAAEFHAAHERIFAKLTKKARAALLEIPSKPTATRPSTSKKQPAKKSSPTPQASPSRSARP